MKILHIIHALQRASGASLFCAELCNHLRLKRNDAVIVCQGAIEYPTPDIPTTRVQSAKEITFVPDIVHIHGIWDFFLHGVMRWCEVNKYAYVVSLHGCMMPEALQRGYLRKRMALRLYLKTDLSQSRRIHVTSEHEKLAWDKHNYGVPAEVVPLGCELPLIFKKTASKDRTVLFLSRISPEKGVITLLQAWKRIKTDGWRLIIAGPDWRGHLADVQAFVMLHHINNVDILGPIFGDDKSMLYRSADVFVLPSVTENFGAVIAEALSFGIPVVTTKGTPWAVIEAERCGWVVDLGVEPLIDGLGAAMKLDDHVRHSMGMNGRKLVEQKYSWNVVADQMLSFYGPCCRNPY